MPADREAALRLLSAFSHALLTSSIGFLFGISSLGVGFHFKRFMPSATGQAKRQELYIPQFLFRLLSLAIFGFLLIVGEGVIKKAIFKDSVNFNMALVVVYLFCFFLYCQASEYFRYTSRIKIYNMVTVIVPYAGIFITIAMYLIWRDLNLDYLIFAQVLSLILVTIPFLVKIYREINFKLIFFNASALISDMKLGLPLVSYYIVDTVLSIGDRYVIAYFLSVTAVASYSAAYSLGGLLLFFPKATGVILPAILARTVDSGKKNEARVLVDYTIKGLLIIGIPFIVGSYALSGPILTLLTTPEVAAQAQGIVPIIAMGTLLYGINLIFGAVLTIQMKTTPLFKVNSISAILNVVLNVILMYFIRDVRVAAYTTVLSYAVSFILLWRVMLSEGWQVQFSWETISKTLLASLVMVTVVWGLISYWGMERLTHPFHLTIALLSAIIVYFSVIVLLRIFSDKEMSFIKGFFRFASLENA